MDILAAYREAGSYRGAAEICGTTHKTVRRVVERHNAGAAAPVRKDRGHNYDEVRALVTERVGSGTSFIPFHFGGWWQGKDLLDKYPEGSAPIVRGDAVNTATTYGYDSVTMMQETKTTLCNIEKA